MPHPSSGLGRTISVAAVASHGRGGAIPGRGRGAGADLHLMARRGADPDRRRTVRAARYTALGRRGGRRGASKGQPPAAGTPEGQTQGHIEQRTAGILQRQHGEARHGTAPARRRMPQPPCRHETPAHPLVPTSTPSRVHPDRNGVSGRLTIGVRSDLLPILMARRLAETPSQLT